MKIRNTFFISASFLVIAILFGASPLFGANKDSYPSFTKKNVIKDIYVLPDDGTLIQTSGQLDPIAVTKRFYALNKNKKNTYDFLSIFTTFDDPYPIPYHQSIHHNTSNIGSQSPENTEDNLPKKLLGISYFNNQYAPQYITSKDILKHSLFTLVHETAHQWTAYLGKDEGITGGVHYSNGFNSGFFQDGEWWGDIMGGWPWAQNGDGTFSIYEVAHQGFSRFSLYLMGLAPLSEVTNLQVFTPKDPKNTDLFNIPGTMKIIKIKDLIKKYGARTPSYKKSQKDFHMAYILVTKKDEIVDKSYLDILQWIAADFPVEWNTLTYGRSTINQ